MSNKSCATVEDLVLVWPVYPLWGIKFGDSRHCQVNTSWAAGGSGKGLGMEANQVCTLGTNQLAENC